MEYQLVAPRLERIPVKKRVVDPAVRVGADLDQEQTN